ncbi:MAG: histidine phosphatase family protein [Deltaproteobacteria bacterium]|nr:histidine phosphatase family protein [Deltaproteobacteria bacterium]
MAQYPPSQYTPNRYLSHRIGLLLAVLALTLPLAYLAVAEIEAASPESEPTVVYLVRHAEKTKSHPKDPSLSSVGAQRAAQLALTLRDAGIEHIHSTDFLRTRRTAEPLADRLRLPVELYDPKDLAAVAEKILSTPGRHLVTGHSNTTPQLVELLGGEGGTPIEEFGENDRLYVLLISPTGTVTTLLLRYGDPFNEG